MEIKVDNNFDEKFYEKQIPEVKDYYSNSNYTKKQRYYHHYINYGQHLYKNKKECREKLLGPIEVDKNFDEFLHEKIYPEVKKYFINFQHIFSKRILYYHHYLNHCKIHKDNKQNALKDFDAKTYKFLNPDISWLTDLQTKQHYEWYGFFEKRNYKTEVKLDKNFDPKLYKIYNPDLASLSDSQAILHYLMDGAKEGRVFYTGSYSALRKIKENQNTYLSENCVMLINHEVSLTGAPIFLYDLYDFLVENNYFSNIVMVEPYPNSILPDVDVEKKYHFNDNAKLLKIIENLNPTLIYSNSLNLLLQNLSNFQYWLDRTIFHLHETYEPFYSYVDKNFDIKKLTIKVVSEKIKQEYLKNQAFSNITVFAPFITTKKLEKIEKLSQEECEISKIDYNKVVIGMCGSLCDRKNPLLFYKIAKNCPEHEFLWVGGAKLDDCFTKNGLEKLTNFYWVPNTKNPYKYFKKLDYFFLTSQSDPCPIVVLENLYLNSKIIVLKNNIHTEHNIKPLENYIEIDNLENDKDEDIIRKFQNLKLDKNKNTTNKNKHYIEESYSKPMLSKSAENNFLICSIYVPNLNLNLDYLINLINQFNIRNKFSYKTIISLSFNKDFYSYIGDFTCDPAKKLSKYLLNLQNIIFRKNSGYDIGGLLDGLKYVFDNFTIKEDSKLAYLHNKSNLHWRDISNKIFYVDDETSDTIVSHKFSGICDSKDLNMRILKNHPNIFNLNNKNNIEYSQGTVFRTNINFLTEIYHKYEEIIPNLTNLEKHDDYWVSIMKDHNLFEDYFSNYSNDIFNKPIDKESHFVVCKGLAKNYIELLEKYNLRGIPDCQFENALERYIGYLIFNNKKVLKV